MRLNCSVNKFSSWLNQSCGKKKSKQRATTKNWKPNCYCNLLNVKKTGGKRKENKKINK